MKNMKVTKTKFGLFKIYDDGDGHKYLIPSSEYPEFLERLEYFYKNQTENWEQEHEELVENYEVLEGQEFSVVLDSEIIETVEG